MNFPASIQKCIEAFSGLPTIGRKSAERFVFYLLKKSQTDLDIFADAIKNLKSGVTYCRACGCFSESDPCNICADTKRNQNLLCLVSTTRDMILIENTGSYSGRYHILGHSIDTIKGITPDQLNIKPLLQRLDANKDITEIILALNPTFEGETTALYLQKILKEYTNINLTKLARGLPTGAALEYADESTITNALKNRTGGK